MEYIFLLFTCVCFSIQFVFQKHYEKRTKSDLSACLWNLLVSCVVMAVFLVLKSGFVTEINRVSFFYALLYSVSGIVCSAAIIAAMYYGEVAVISTYCLAGGLVIPFLFGIIILNETAGIIKGMGVLILCLSLLPALLGKRTEVKKKHHVIFIMYCIIIFVTNGLISVFSKMHQISETAVDENNFVLMTALIRIVVILLVIFAMAQVQKKENRESVWRAVFWEIGRDKMTGKLFLKLLIFSGGYAVCNALGNLFSLRCMTTMEASVQFPLISAGVIILSALWGQLFFREKITKETVASLLPAVIGIILMIQ